MNIGIVGNEEAKFDDVTERAAKDLICRILARTPGFSDYRVVSGGCHLGGVDIWAEKVADMYGLPKIIHLPKNQRWETGYKPRNLLIAQDSDIVHVILVKEYPLEYTGMRFPLCYHCGTTDHIKSGGCWTARQAMLMGKPAVWHVISPDGTVTSTEN